MAAMVNDTAKGLQSCPIEGCRNYRYPGNYLCAAHWRRLPVKTKQALRRKDNHATARLRLMWEAIDAGTPLNKIRIVDPAEYGLTDGIPMLEKGRVK